MEHNNIAEFERDEGAWRASFRDYFSGMKEGGGLLKFTHAIKTAMIFLGGALWSMTIAVSVYQGYRIVRDGMQEFVTIETIVATAGLLIAGGVIFEIVSWDRLWREVLYNFWRYFVLLILVPSLFWAAWFVPQTDGPQTLKYAIGAAAALLILIGYWIGSTPPPPVERVESFLDAAFQVDVQRHLTHVTKQIGAGRDGTAALVLCRFPDTTELGGRTPSGRQANDKRPRINPQGFVALMCTSSVLSCEGAVDMTTGEIIHHRLREFEYRDIAMLAIEGTGAPFPDGQQPGPIRNPMLHMGRRRLVPTYKEAFVVGLRGGGSITVVVRDGKALNDMRSFEGIQESEVEPLTKWDELQRAWKMLSDGKRTPPSGGALA